MNNYYQKYIKYKQKYNNLKYNQSNKLNNGLLNNGLLNNGLLNNILHGGDKTQKIILLDGTSSAGKSTFCKYFKTKDYACFSINNY